MSEARTSPCNLPGGIHPVLYALFDRSGRLDRGAMGRQVEICLEQGASGIVVLGLATEVRALAREERRRLVEWTAAALSGRRPFGVTIFEETTDDCIEAARHAADHGAGWVIFQPPAGDGSEDDLAASFGEVLSVSPLPAAIQNAPQFIGRGLGIPAILELAARHEAFRLIKQEVPAVECAELVERIADRLTVFTGRGGIELPDGWRAGTSGHIPAPEYADRLVAVWERLEAGDEAGAREAYAQLLPLATFVVQSIDTLLTYGKLLFCARYGLPFHLRQAHLKISPFGLDALAAHAAFAGLEADLAATAGIS